MATLKLRIGHIDKITATTQQSVSLGPVLIIDCDMSMYDMEDAIEQFSEQMGDEAFMEFVTKMMT